METSSNSRDQMQSVILMALLANQEMYTLHTVSVLLQKGHGHCYACYTDVSSLGTIYGHFK